MTQPARSQATSRAVAQATSRATCQDRDGNRVEPLTGRTVIDDRGAAVGTVAGVVYEDADKDPSWLVVGTRWRRTRHYVPFDGTYPTAAGDLVVPFDRSWVRAAPRASSDDETLSYETRRRLATHYGDNYEWWPRRRAAAMLASA